MLGESESGIVGGQVESECVKNRVKKRTCLQTTCDLVVLNRSLGQSGMRKWFGTHAVEEQMSCGF